MTVPSTPAEGPAAGVPVGAAATDEPRRCTECQSVLTPGARVCSHCKAHQDRRRYLVLAGMIIPVLIGLGTVARNFSDLVVWTKGLFASGVNVTVTEPECSPNRVAITLVNRGKSQVLMENLRLSVFDGGVLRNHDLALLADNVVVKAGDSTKITIKANVQGIPIIFPSSRDGQCAFEIAFDLAGEKGKTPHKVRCNCN